MMQDKTATPTKCGRSKLRFALWAQTAMHYDFYLGIPINLHFS